MEKPFEHKLVAVLNKNIESGRLMNALAHMSFGLGSLVDRVAGRCSDYRDADGGVHPSISDLPFIVLRAAPNKLRKLRNEAKENDLLCVDFTDTMTTGTYVEQQALTEKTPEADLTYLGLVLFGKWNKISELTKKFSLWR